MPLPQLPQDWNNQLKEELISEYFQELSTFWDQEKQANKIIYPPNQNIFTAFEKTAFRDVKVIIIGQDPYHGEGQAMGLSFSVPPGVKIPPSLRNVFKELMVDLNIEYPMYGDLTPWANQGVLLLNAVLTVERKSPGSHSKKGWEIFTNRIIEILSEKRKDLVFLLWGNYARKKKELIDMDKHLVLEAAHPSPLARNKFFGNQHFSKTNEYLIKHNKKPIIWKLD